MTDEISGTACCAGMAGCTSASCEDAAGSQAPFAHAVTVEQQCMMATVAGGSLTEPTIVEKEYNGQQTLKADVLPSAVYDSAIGSRVDLSVFKLSSSRSNFSTPSVEKYVLNATFLI
jgi:hypothetical protein